MNHVRGGEKKKLESGVRLTGAPDYFEPAKWRSGWRSLIKVVGVPCDAENERIAIESLPMQLSSSVKCARGGGGGVTSCNAAFATLSNVADEKMCS